MWPGRRGLAGTAERPFTLNWPSCALGATGSARGGAAAPPSVVPGVLSASARRSAAPPNVRPGVCPSRSSPAGSARPGPGSLLQAGPPTPRPQSWGWLSTEGFEAEHCPPPVLFLNAQPSPVASPHINLFSSLSYQPFNLPGPLYFHG